MPDQSGYQEPTEGVARQRASRGITTISIVLLLFAAIVAFAALAFFSPLIGRKLADRAIEPVCAKEGGIRVVEPIRLQAGEFASVDRSNKPGEVVGTILDRYRIVRRHEFQRMYSASVYRYVTAIERISDGVRIAEMVQFFREGDEVFHGKHCPSGISERQLVNATFQLPGGQVTNGDSYPSCESRQVRWVSLALSDRSKAMPVTARPDMKDPKWQRALSCQGKTEIDTVYTAVGPGETRLMETRLLFDGKDGKRCQALAMADPDRVICSGDGIYLIGRKTISLNDNILIEKFASDGALVFKAEIQQTKRGPGRIVGYRETATQLAIDVVALESNRSTCQSLLVSKPPGLTLSLLPPHEGIAQYLPGCSGI